MTQVYALSLKEDIPGDGGTFLTTLVIATDIKTIAKFKCNLLKESNLLISKGLKYYKNVKYNYPEELHLFPILSSIYPESEYIGKLSKRDLVVHTIPFI